MGLFQTVFRGSDEMYFKAEEELNAVIAELPPAEVEEAEEDVVHIAIVGRPNAGKSSLVNAILQEDRVIMRGEVCISSEGTFLYPELEPFAGM